MPQATNSQLPPPMELRKFMKRFFTDANDMLRAMQRPSWWQNYILSSPIRIASFILGVMAVLVVGVSLWQGMYTDRNFQINIISEMHGVLFDILILGILMLWLNRLGEKRLEQKKYHEEIDDFRKLESLEAKQRIIGNIRRLNKYGVSAIDLRMCYLGEASLTEVNLAGANLWDANLAGAKMQGADLSAAMMPGIVLSDAKMMCANLGEANVSGAKLARIDLWEANLFKANFESSDLTGANLSSVNAEQSDFSSAILTDALLNAANFSHANLPGTMLDNANLTGANLEYATIWNSNFAGAILVGAELHHADCTGSVFSGATLAETNLAYTNFSNADLTQANFAGANFEGATLSGADCTGANLQGAQNLTLEQIATMRSLHGALLDDDLRAAIQEQSPHLLVSEA
jgi:uncharacterized protein YjbI with pentapeptide repeats